MNLRRVIGSTALAGLLLGAALTPASADTTGHWATITIPDAGSKTAAVSLPGSVGFPGATMATDSRTIQVFENNSAFIGDLTPPGGVYGSSRSPQPSDPSQPKKNYLNLRPAADNATSPSTTIYTFDSPTPSAGWSFTLGDIDAEFLDVAATDAEGNPVPLSALGFKSAFSYCGVGAGTATCDAQLPQAVPGWDPATGRLSGPGPEQLPNWSNTEGAAAWFEPTVALSTLTITSTQRTGLPTYQTWFAALSRDITGTVTGSAECSTAGLAVAVLDGDGDPVADTKTDENGDWTIEGLATYDDWTVTVTPPEGCVVDPDGDLIADLSEDDAVVDVGLQPDEAPTPTPEPTDPEPTPAPTSAPTSAPTAAPTSPATSVSPAEQVTAPLPDTGGSSPWWLIGGGALLLGGAGALVAGSRRRR